MAGNFMPGFMLGDKLCKALGIEGDVMRLVIDCPADGLVTVYIQRPLDQAEVPPLLEVLEEAAKIKPPLVVEAREIDVDEKGRVTAR